MTILNNSTRICWWVKNTFRSRFTIYLFSVGKCKSPLPPPNVNVPSPNVNCGFSLVTSCDGRGIRVVECSFSTLCIHDGISLTSDGLGRINLMTSEFAAVECSFKTSSIHGSRLSVGVVEGSPNNSVVVVCRDLAVVNSELKTVGFVSDHSDQKELIVVVSIGFGVVVRIVVSRWFSLTLVFRVVANSFKTSSIHGNKSDFFVVVLSFAGSLFQADVCLVVFGVFLFQPELSVGTKCGRAVVVTRFVSLGKTNLVNLCFAGFQIDGKSSKLFWENSDLDEHNGPSFGLLSYKLNISFKHFFIHAINKLLIWHVRGNISVLFARIRFAVINLNWMVTAALQLFCHTIWNVAANTSHSMIN